MINRELIRTKIVQLTYAYYQNGGRNIENAEKELLLSLSKAYDLYNYLLDLIIAVTKEERRRVELLSVRSRREGTEEPSSKFIFNKFAVQLEENKTLSSFNEDKNMSWDGDADFVRKLCDKIEQSEVYKEYMAVAESDYEADREMWRKLYRQLIKDNEDLDALLEEKSIYWNDDKEVVDTFVLKTIKRFDPKEKGNQELLPEYKDESDYEADREMWRKLYRQLIKDNEDLDALLEEKSIYWNDDKEVVDTFVLKTIKRFDPKEKGNQELLPEYKDEDDKEFARKLFRAAILNANDYQRYMSETSRNWDFSRLAYMDVIIMQIAIAELLNFPNIPATVTINEYVDMAKRYSTPRSGGYINGMLDAIARHLINTGKMLKEMPPRQERWKQAERRPQGSYSKPVRFVHRANDVEASSTQDKAVGGDAQNTTDQ